MVSPTHEFSGDMLLCLVIMPFAYQQSEPWHSIAALPSILAKASAAVWSMQGTQLFIRSFELGVMFLPSLEACYQQHPHKAFTCTPQGFTQKGPSSEPSLTPLAPQDPFSGGPTTAPEPQGLVTHCAGSDKTIEDVSTGHVGTSSAGE